MHDDVDDDNYNEAYREAADSSGAQCHNAVREAGDHLGACDQKGCAPEEVLHTKGGYEGMRQVQSGQQCAVDQADDCAGDQGNEDQDYRVCHAAFDQHKVDTCCDQAEQHTCGQERCEGRLLEDGHQVGVGQELVSCDRQYDAEDNQRANGTKIRRKAA